MAKFGDFCKIVSSYADVADFVMVYIEEAHPVESLALRNNLNINVHRTIEDRIEAARHLLRQDPTFPIVCDVMDDTASYTYGAQNERLYVIHRGKIAYEGGRGPMFYRLHEVQEWLENYLQISNKTDQVSESEAAKRKQMLDEFRSRYVNTGQRGFWAKLGRLIWS